MIVGFIFLLLKIFLAFVVFFGLWVCYKHFKAMQDIKRFEAQGAVTIPGARRFFFGNIIDLITREKMAETKQVPVHGVWLQDYILAPS